MINIVEGAQLGIEVANEGGMLESEGTISVVEFLDHVGKEMSVQEAANALARFVRAGHPSIHGDLLIREVFYAMSDVLARRRGEEKQLFDLSEEEKRALADLFASFQEKLPLIIRSQGFRGHAISGLRVFLVRNPELAETAAPLVGDLLCFLDQIEHSQLLILSLNIVGQTMSVKRACEILARFNRENNIISDIRIRELFDAMSAVLARRRGEEGQLTDFSEEEKQELIYLFISFQEKLSRLIEQNCTECIGSMYLGLQNFLERNPELAGMAAPLFNRVAAYAPPIPLRDNTRISVRDADEIDGKKFVERFLPGISQEEKDKIIEGLNASQSPEEVERRIKVLGAIFLSNSSKDLQQSLEMVGIGVQELPQILSDEVVTNLVVPAIVSRVEHYRFQVAVMVSQVPNMPALKMIRPEESDDYFNIEPVHKCWYLCKQAETRLEKALHYQAVVLVNSGLLVKFRGKMCALCLKTFTNKNGYTFLEGMWYSPSDIATTNLLENAFYNGVPQIQLKQGKWVIMRPLAGSNRRFPLELLLLAKKFIENLPQQWPQSIFSVPRGIYRKMNSEPFEYL